MFDIGINNTVVIKNPEVLLIDKFKTIWDKDKAKTKSTALKEFAYIYFKNDFKSPYRNAYSNKELPAKLKDVLQLPKTWKVTKAISEAEKEYVELQTTKELKALIAAETALEQVIAYFEDFDITEVDNDDKALAIKRLMDNIKSIDEVTGKLSSAKERVAKSLETKKLSGTKKLGSRETPKKRI